MDSRIGGKIWSCEAAAQKICIAAMSAPSETPWTRYSKELEENPSPADT